MKKTPHLNEVIGYSFERLVLFAQSLVIGTVWAGGTMDRSAFKKPLIQAKAGKLGCALEMVRPIPSAVNKQP